MTGQSIDASEFAPYFRSRAVHPVMDAVWMRRAFELRYQVYCQECGFLAASAYPDGLESDDYDAASAHFCAFNLAGDLVGYVRLVRASGQAGLPFQRHCSELQGDAERPLATESAEISRLMVRQDYRRRRGDILAGVTVDESATVREHDRRVDSPQILLSLYREMYAFSLANGIRYWYAAMERALARTLNRMNFAFRQVGPQTDYYGPVAPYLADLREIEARVGEHNPSLMAWLQRSGPAGG